MHILNPAGRLLWRALASGQPLDRAARKLARRFKIPLARALADCRGAAVQFEQIRQESVTAGDRLPAAPLSRTQPAARASGGWTGRIAGQGFRLQADAELHLRLRNVIGHLYSPHSHAPSREFEVLPLQGGFALKVNGHELSRSRTLSGLQYRLMQALAALALAAPGRLAWLHAGAVLHGGRCLVFPARGGSGKTTLVAGLMARGHSVLADDVLGVADANLDILALPLPLSIKQGSWPVLAPRFPELTSYPVLAIGPKRVRLLPPIATAGAWEQGHCAAALVQPLYQRGAPAHLEACPPWEMAQAVFDARSVIGMPDARRVRRLVRWIGRLPAFRLTYGDLDQALDRLDRLRLP